jgi:hypothetical protein
MKFDYDEVIDVSEQAANFNFDSYDAYYSNDMYLNSAEGNDEMEMSYRTIYGVEGFDLGEKQSIKVFKVNIVNIHSKNIIIGITSSEAPDRTESLFCN